MTCIDTSALYALVDRKDPEHSRAVDLLAHLLDRSEGLLTHNYVLVETMALAQRRIGVEAALAVATKARLFEIEWVTDVIHEEALKRLEASKRRHVSFVDCASFVVMQQRGIDTAFAFDPDFQSEGFRLFDALS